MPQNNRIKFVPAYYARYFEGHSGCRSRVGGLPSHLPPRYPTCENCGEFLAFFMQLYMDEVSLFPDDWLALQLYACSRAGCFGTERLIQVSKQAAPNEAGVGVAHPNVEQKDIVWELKHDPDPGLYADDVDLFWDDDAMVQRFPNIDDDKLGGFFPWCDHGANTGYRLGAIGQFKNPIQESKCNMIYMYDTPKRGLYFDFF